jgi:hypothetical protein
MNETEQDEITFTVKLPKNLLEELKLRIPKGVRGNFIKDAIAKELEVVPRPDRLSTLEQRLEKTESEIIELKKTLAQFDILTYEQEKVNPLNYCEDNIDRKIIDLITQRGGATTPEIAKVVGVNRYLILNRLQRMQKRSERKLGKPAIIFSPMERMGKKRAWWVNPELVS